MDTRQRICAGLLLGFLKAALLLHLFDDTRLTLLLLLLLPPLLAVVAARLRFSLPQALARALATTLGAATLTLCWAHAETQVRQATNRAERDYMLGESAFLAAVAAATPPELLGPKDEATQGIHSIFRPSLRSLSRASQPDRQLAAHESAPPPARAANDGTYEAPWDNDVERIEHIGPWPTPGGPPLPLTFRWLETDTTLDNRPCGPGVQRFTHGARTVSAMSELPRWPMYLRVPPLGTHIWLIALALALALLITRRTALARMLVGAALLTGLAWARAPVTLDATYGRQLTLAAQDLLSARQLRVDLRPSANRSPSLAPVVARSARPVDPAMLTPCPAPPDVRFAPGPTGIEADVSRHEERKWLILLSFLGISLALGAVLGLLIHGLERPRRV